MELNKIYCADCLELMKQIPDKSIDLILTDPPYGINADILHNKNAGNKGGNKGGRYKQYFNQDWDSEIPSKEYFDEIFRISKNQIIFGGNYMTEYLYPSRCWIIWDKVVRGGRPDAEMAWGSFDKGIKIYNYSRADAYINDCPNKQHPTQKPIKLFRRILENYSEPGMTILDPFLGSGTTAVACKELGRNFIGIEKEQKYVDIANKRLKNTTISLFV